MTEYVYLIRNGDLYNIGRTENLELIKKKLAPGILEAALETKDAKPILKILQNKYSDRSLPESSYYRLTKEESMECKLKLKVGRNQNDFKPFFSGIKLFITVIIAWCSISILIIRFGIEPIFDKFN